MKLIKITLIALCSILLENCKIRANADEDAKASQPQKIEEKAKPGPILSSLYNESDNLFSILDQFESEYSLCAKNGISEPAFFSASDLKVIRSLGKENVGAAIAIMDYFSTNQNESQSSGNTGASSQSANGSTSGEVLPNSSGNQWYNADVNWGIINIFFGISIAAVGVKNYFEQRNTPFGHRDLGLLYEKFQQDKGAFKVTTEDFIKYCETVAGDPEQMKDLKGIPIEKNKREALIKKHVKTYHFGRAMNYLQMIVGSGLLASGIFMAVDGAGALSLAESRFKCQANITLLQNLAAFKVRFEKQKDALNRLN